MADSRRGTDRFLVAEVLLALILFAIAVYFFVVPSGSAPALPPWWVGIVLAILFFAIVLLETFRRLGHQRSELRRALREDRTRDPDL
jgi:membrane protein implicated in regulation of membrane protease activity